MRLTIGDMEAVSAFLRVLDKFDEEFGSEVFRPDCDLIDVNGESLGTVKYEGGQFSFEGSRD